MGVRPDLHVELSHKTRKVVVFEMLGQDIPRELHDVADNERRSCVIPGNQVLILLVNHHANNKNEKWKRDIG